MPGLEKKTEFVFMQLDFHNYVPREVKITLCILHFSFSSLLIAFTEESCILDKCSYTHKRRQPPCRHLKLCMELHIPEAKTELREVP